MKVLPVSILLFFLACFHSSFCQIDFQKGYIITADGDSLKGELSFSYKVPFPLKFRAAGSDEARTFEQKDIASFGVDNAPNQTYRYMDIDVASRNNQLLNYNPDPILSKKHVFLEHLESGKLNLYYFKDNWGYDHFFINRKDGSIEELVFTRYKTNKRIKGILKPVVVNNNQFQIQLTFIMSDCAQAYGLIDKTSYHAKDLRKLVKTYNECHGKAISHEEVKLKKAEVSFGVLGGLSFTKYLATNFLPERNFKRNMRPYLGVSLKADKIFGYKDISALNELSIVGYSTTSTYTNLIRENHKEDNHYTVSSTSLRLSSMIRYKFSNGFFRPFLSVGLSMGRSIISKSVLLKETTINNTITDATTTRFGVEKPVEISFLVGGGSYLGPIFIEARYGLGTAFGREYNSSQAYALVGFEF